MKRSALIFGIGGQDGILLTQLLIEKDYQIVGFGREQSLQRNPHLVSFGDRVRFHFGDMRDPAAIECAVREHPTAEIYNFAAQSLPSLSWDAAIATGEVNALGAHRLFEAVRRFRPQAKLYQASSSDMFGRVLESPQTETTPFRPINPYGVSKTYAHHMAGSYRAKYGLFICCGILFNHESRYRDLRFLSQKVAYGAACARHGITDSPELNESGEPIVHAGKLSLGNLDVVRDWGYAGDYVQATWLMLQQDTPDDYVIGTGVRHTVRDMCQVAYARIGADWRDHVVSDTRLTRPIETGETIANARRARETLGWTARTSFETMLGDMIDAHLDHMKKHLVRQ